MRPLLVAVAATLALATPVTALPSGAVAHSAIATKVCHRGTPARINGATSEEANVDRRFSAESVAVFRFVSAHPPSAMTGG